MKQLRTLTYEDVKNNDSYILKCRDNYFKSIRPSNPNSKSTEDYQIIVSIAKAYLKDHQKDFAGYFIEGQYNIDLWTAHLIIEYGTPDNQLRQQCIGIIKDYSETPLDATLAKEETDWLKIFNDVS